MRGRKAKPAKILRFERKSHLSKENLAAREAAEIKIGDNVFIAPDFVQADGIAFAKWKELLAFYHDAPTQGLVTSADIDIIAQYCSLFSEQKYLIMQRAEAKSEKKKLKYTTMILKNRDMMLKYSNHILTNPIARIRNVPKKQMPKDSNQLEMEGFGFI